MKKLLMILVGLSLCGNAVALKTESDALPAEDRAYLEGVYKDTWAFIGHFVHPATGFPYDSHRPTPNTSLTNIGFYMASTAMAARTGLISEEDALQRISKCLKSLARVEKWRGFPVTWVDVATGRTTEKQFSTVDHLGNLYAGLVLVKNVFPSLTPLTDAVLGPMNWGVMYETSNRLYRGGWRLDKNDFDIKQPWGNWYYGYLGADTRLGSFFGITRGQVPLEHWGALDRRTETRYGQNYFVPGWQGGGLFKQTVSGLFMDEREAPVGISAGNFAYAQILHAEKIRSPVWGWSAAESPAGEYLGWGAIKDEVVTPHASALAALFYPRKAAANLRKLEELGARRDYNVNGKPRPFGFRDSFNWKTGQAAPGYLMLDQTLLFLALADVLYDGMVWRYFERDPLVKKGRTLLTDYLPQVGVMNVYRQRDASPPDEKITLPLEP
jgi:hypothetical protein